jgi:hypothetical protein
VREERGREEREGGRKGGDRGREGRREERGMEGGREREREDRVISPKLSTLCYAHAAHRQP